MKLRLVTGAAIAAAAIALPAVANAVTYAPYSASDPAGDVQVQSTQQRGLVVYPEIDETTIRGARSSVQHSVAVKYVDLQKTPYTRYVIALQKPGSPQVRALEVRVGPSGKVNTAYYLVNQQTGTIQQAYCTGARIVPDFEKGRITAVLPQKCFANTASSVQVYAQTGEWSAGSWTSGPLTAENNGSDADAVDYFDGVWSYDGGTAPSTGKSNPLRLF